MHIENLMQTVDQDGKPLRAVLLAEVALTPARVKDGFSSDLLLAIYPATAPCIVLCFNYRGKHMHLSTHVPSEKEVVLVMRVATASDEDLNALCELTLRQSFDSIPEAHRVMLEVTSAAPEGKVN